MKLLLEPHHLPALLLLSTATLLVLKIGAEVAREHHSSLPPSQQETRNIPDLTLALQAEYSLPPMEKSYNAMLTRPLFSPGRRPTASASGTVLPSTMRKGQFTLLGVIITGDRKIAMLRENATSKVSNVEQGSEINGMQLEKLEPEKATLKQGEEREELTLNIQPVAKQQQPAPQPPGDNAANLPPAAATAVAPVTPGSSQDARRPMSNAILELIARRRAAHGLPPK